MTFIVDGTNGLTFPNSTTQASAAGIPPTVTTYTSGSGTYTTPTGAKYLTVEMVGGGGGGCGSGSGFGVGGSGGTTTFGSSLLTCTGGAGGTAQSADAGVGGSATLNSPAVGLASAGNRGQNNGSYATAVNIYTFGAGRTPTPLSLYGSGGHGGNAASGNITIGSGGGSAGYITAYITSPSSTYSYAVGAAGTGGTAGTSGQAGGAGGSGAIIIAAYF